MIAQLRPGLHRWTAPHPEWEPGAEPGGPLDWPERVGSVAVAVEGGLVVVDPQLPADPEAIWPELDVSHGEPVLQDGHAALSKALA